MPDIRHLESRASSAFADILLTWLTSSHLVLALAASAARGTVLLCKDEGRVIIGKPGHAEHFDESWADSARSAPAK